MTQSMTFPQLRSLSNGDGRMTTTAPDDETPVLLIRRTINRHTITIWCEHCKREHWHGRSAGHRIAHCAPDSGSPYLLMGYVIR